MSNNDNTGLYIGAALLGLGGVYLLSQSGSESGGGLGETIREQIESIVAVPQVFTEKTRSYITEVIDNTKEAATDAVKDVIPSGDEIITGAGNAGTAAGASIGGAIASAFLNGVASMYLSAGVVGAHFVGRDDVNSDNVGSEFWKSFDRIKDNSMSTVYYGVPKAAGFLLKGALLGGDASEASRYLSGSTNNSNSSVSSLITGFVSSTVNSSRKSSGGNGSAKLQAFKAGGSQMTSNTIKNTAGINVITQTLKKKAGVA